MDTNPKEEPDINTSEGARRLVARYFAIEMGRHDFGDYIATHLAADFACALAKHLYELPTKQPEGLMLSDAEASLARQWFDHALDTDTSCPGYLGKVDYLLVARLYAHEGMRLPNSIRIVTEGEDLRHG
ncbi:hypothetical protein ABM187_003652 [Stenotrophomonas maltophilia]